MKKEGFETHHYSRRRGLAITLLVTILIISTLLLLHEASITGLVADNTSTTANQPPAYAGPSSFSTPQDTPLTIDLAPFFTDPEDDVLTFLVAEEDQIAATVIGSIVTLTPAPGFAGERVLTIVASDDANVVRVFVRLAVGQPDFTAPIGVPAENATVPETPAEDITVPEPLQENITLPEPPAENTTLPEPPAQNFTTPEPAPEVRLGRMIGLDEDISDESGTVVGRKLADEPDYETFFTFIGINGADFAVRFYHNATTIMPVRMEGNVTATLSTSIANPGEEVSLSVLLQEGSIPNFTLHVGLQSEVFEFGSQSQPQGFGPLDVITSCNVTMNTSTALAQNLTGNSNCIIFGNDSIELDCAGFTIFYGASGGRGNAVIASNHTNITVKNCNIIDNSSAVAFGIAINFTNTSNSFIINNTIQTNGTNDNYGILLHRNSSNNTIVNNTILPRGSTTTNVGIFVLFDSLNNTIDNNRINTTGTSGNYGINVNTRSHNSSVTNNIVQTGLPGVAATTGNDAIVIDANSRDATVTNNDAISNGTSTNHGITVITNGNNARIVNNTILSDGSAGTDNGIRIESNSNDVLIENNTIRSGRPGETNNFAIVLITGVSGTIVRSNVINTRGTIGNEGIRLQSAAQNVTILRNTINASGTTTDNYGIQLLTSVRNVTIAHNLINTSGTSANYGILLTSAVANNTIANNTIRTRGTTTNNYGIYLLTTVENNTIDGNRIDTSGTGTTGSNGITLQATTRNNSIVYNNITANGTSSDNLGIYIFTGSTRSTIHNNTIVADGTKNNYGIRFDTAADNATFIDNNITTMGNDSFGIRMDNSQGNSFARNNISTSATSLFIEGTVIEHFSTHSIAANNFINGSAIQYYGGAGASPACPNNQVLNAPTNFHIDFIGCLNVTLTNFIAQEFVTLVNTVNMTVSNIQVYPANKYGIRVLLGANGNVLVNNTLQTNSTFTDNYGIWLARSAQNNTVVNNSIKTGGVSTDNYGIYLFNSSSNNTVMGNLVNTTGTTTNIGIRIEEGSNSNTIISNEVRTRGATTTNHGIHIFTRSSANLIHNNTIITNGSATNFGIYLQTNALSSNVTNNTVVTSGSSTNNVGIRLEGGSNHNLVANNTVQTGIGSTTDNYGIQLVTSVSNATLIDNTVQTAGSAANYGIYLTSVVQNNTIKQNTVRTIGTSTTNYGIYVVTTSHNNTITENNINTSGTTGNYGVLLQSTIHNTSVRNNVIRARGTGTDNNGIYLLTTTINNIIVNNTIFTNGTSTNVGILLESTARNNTVTNNTITTNGTGNTNYGIYLFTTAFLNNVSNNIITTDGLTHNNTGILLDTRGDNNTVAFNAITTVGSTVNNFGIQLLGISRLNNITGNTISTRANLSHGILLQNGPALNNISGNNISASGTNSFAIFILRANHTLLNDNVLLNTSQWINSTANSLNNNFTNTTFENGVGMIRIPGNFSLTGMQEIGVARLNVTQNRAFLNSTNLTFLNQSGQVTLRGITFTEPKTTIDFEDDGTFADCPPSICTIDRFESNVLKFNVTQFTSFSSAEGGLLVVLTKIDAPDPVNASSLLNYTITINVSNSNASNVTITDDYPDQVIFQTATPTPVTGTNNTFIAGNITNGSSFATNITVLVGNVTNGTVLVNFVNISYNNLTGGVLSSNVTETTTVLAPAIDGCAQVNQSLSLSRNVTANASCISFGADNVVFDCAGFTITYGTNGTMNDTYGINVTDRSGVTVRNCVIRKGNESGLRSHGIVLVNASRAQVLNNIITTNGSGRDDGIELLGAPTTTRVDIVTNPNNLNNPQCLNNQTANVTLCNPCFTTVGGVDCALLGATACSDGSGFKTETLLRFNISSTVQPTGGDAEVIGGEGVFCRVNEVQVIGFGTRNNCGTFKRTRIPASAFISGAENNFSCSIAGWGSDEDNGFKLSAFSYDTPGPAIAVGNITVRNNTVLATGGNQSHGIFVDVIESVIANNTITTAGDHLGHGILVSGGGRSNIIANNTITTITRASDGIQVLGGSRNTLFNNSFANFTRAAIRLEGALNNTINSSTIPSMLPALTSLFISEPDGTINYTEAITVLNDTNLANVMNISLNFTRLNTTRFGGQQFNRSAALQFFGMPFFDNRPVVDFEDDFTFQACNEPRCTGKNYSADTRILRYNVSSFTTYAAIEISACATLDLDFNRTEQTFTLINNVSSQGTCFTIIASNITLDCAGFTVSYGGTGVTSNGVNVQNTFATNNIDNITVKNCFIEKNGTSGEDAHGIRVQHASNVTLQLNNITTRSNRSHGIALVNATNLTIVNNTIAPEEDALRIDGAVVEHWSTHEVVNNTANFRNVTYYGGRGLSPACPNNQVLSQPNFPHITLVRCANVTIVGFNASDRLTVVDSNFTNVSNSVFANNTRGIGVFFARSTLIRNNTISTAPRGGNNFGIQASGGAEVNITLNTIQTDGTSSENFGVLLSNLTDSRVVNNTIFTNGTFYGRGIAVLPASPGDLVRGLLLANNTIRTFGSASDNDGIAFNGSQTVSDSNITGNFLQINGTFSNNGIEFSASNGTNILMNNNTIRTRGSSTHNVGITFHSATNITRINVSSNIIETNGTTDNYGIAMTATAGDFIIIQNNSVNTSGTGGVNEGISIFSFTDLAEMNITENSIQTGGTTFGDGIFVGGTRTSSIRILNNTIRALGNGSSNNGIYVSSRAAQGYRIIANIVRTNGSGTNIGIILADTSGQSFNHSLIENNTIETSGGLVNGGGNDGISTTASNTIVHNATVVNNSIRTGPNATSSTNSSTNNGFDVFDFRDSTITRNTIVVTSGGLSLGFDGVGRNVTVTHNTFLITDADSNTGMDFNGNNITIVNNTITILNNTNSVGITGVTSSLVENNTIFACCSTSNSGTLNLGTDNTIRNNTVTTCCQTSDTRGIKTSTNTLVEMNVVHTNGTGIDPGVNNTVVGNVITANTGMTFGSSGSTTQNSTARLNNITAEGDGIVIHGRNITLIGNRIVTNGLAGGAQGVFLNANGFNTESGLNVHVENNVIITSSNGSDNYGVLLEGNITNVTILNNTIQANGTGNSTGIRLETIFARFSANGEGGLGNRNPITNSRIENNVITTEGPAGKNTGILLWRDVFNTTIRGNRINTTGARDNFGIFLFNNASQATIENNNITANGSNSYAIFLLDGSLGALSFNDSFEDGTLDPFTTFGDGAWAINSSFNASGTNSTKSPALSANQSSNLSLNLTIPMGRFHFQFALRRSLNSEGANIDRIRFFVDNTSVFTLTSTVTAFSKFNASLDEGTHNLRWQFDDNTAAATTGVLIDDVQLFPGKPSTNNTFTGMRLSGREWLLVQNSSANARFTDITFDEPNGSIRILPLVLLENDTNLTKRKLNITFNRAFLNSSNLSLLNISGQVALRGIGGDNPSPIVDFEDDGTFIACNPPQCIEQSFSNGVFVYNVTSFTAYSSSEGNVNVTLSKGDNPDPVNPGGLLNYTITINVTDGNASNTTLTDIYPPQVIFINSSPPNSTGNNTFIIGNRSAGSSFSVNITVLVNNGTAGIVMNNTANISFQNSTGVTIFLNVTENTTVRTPAPFNLSNISMNKTDNPDPVTVGRQLNYTINVTSTGNGTAYNVTVNDTYPTQVIFNSAQPAPLSGTNNTFILGNLTNGTSSLINITVNVSSTLTNGTILTNTVNTTFQNETSQALQSRLAIENTTVLAPIFNISNLTVTKIDTPDPVNMSSRLNYTIFVNITGNGTAYNVTVNDTYPTQVIFINASPTPLSGTNNTFILGNLTPGTNFSINITVFVQNVSNNITINNSVNVSFQNETGQVLSINTTISTTVVFIQPIILNFSNISVIKTDAPDPVTVGRQLNYTINVTSNGNGTAYNVTVNDTYPAGVIFNNATPTPLAGTNNTFILGNLTPGTSSLINITVNVSSTLTNGTILTNIVNATFQNETSQALQSRLAIENTTVLTPIFNISNLTVTKIDTPDPVNMSSRLNYTIFVNITGNGTAFNVTVNDTYPAQVIFQNASPQPLAGTNNTFILSNLTPGTNFSINITIFVQNVSNNITINNTVNVTFQNETSQALQSRNITISTTVAFIQPTVFNFSNLSVTKLDAPDPAENSTQLNYTIVVNSTGNGTAYNVTVNDTYPNQIIFNSAQPSPVPGTNNSFVLGNLTPGNSVTINITLNVTSPVSNGTVINNTVNVSFQNETSQAFQNVTASASTTLFNGTAPSPQPPAPAPAPGGGGGSGGRPGVEIKPPEVEAPAQCVENWLCEGWGPCAGGVRVRACTDQNACNITRFIPATQQQCSVPEPAPPRPAIQPAPELPAIEQPASGLPEIEFCKVLPLGMYGALIVLATLILLSAVLRNPKQRKGRTVVRRITEAGFLVVLALFILNYQKCDLLPLLQLALLALLVLVHILLILLTCGRTPKSISPPLPDKRFYDKLSNIDKKFAQVEKGKLSPASKKEVEHRKAALKPSPIQGLRMHEPRLRQEPTRLQRILTLPPRPKHEKTEVRKPVAKKPGFFESLFARKNVGPSKPIPSPEPVLIRKQERSKERKKRVSYPESDRFDKAFELLDRGKLPAAIKRNLEKPRPLSLPEPLHMPKQMDVPAKHVQSALQKLLTVPHPAPPKPKRELQVKAPEPRSLSRSGFFSRIFAGPSKHVHKAPEQVPRASPARMPDIKLPPITLPPQKPRKDLKKDRFYQKLDSLDKMLEELDRRQYKRKGVRR